MCAMFSLFLLCLSQYVLVYFLPPSLDGDVRGHCGVAEPQHHLAVVVPVMTVTATMGDVPDVKIENKDSSNTV